MQVLLLPEHFRQPIELQVVKRKEDAHVRAETLNSTIFSAIGQTEPHDADELEDSTLPEEVSKANQKDKLYSVICSHLEDFTKHAKSEGVKLKSCRVSKGLLMKRNQL